VSEELAEAVERATPLGRAGRPKDAAEVVAFLVSLGAGWITSRSSTWTEATAGCGRHAAAAGWIDDSTYGERADRRWV
jgi:NAD(P)-dependent dehydrogenase (short-subunit alcohol dehydrogenase family)